ncbi:MAG: TetR/AcrR family transcriptional regulator [Candidatus Latescibacteria bacterium]|nr:TetR/AcrR family transcriptional regulator [Candidatus Latescibacterota bacterium]
MGDDLDQKRERLFEAAGPLFERFGYRKTTVEEICRAAGMSKKTFYELFNGKEHLFVEITTEMMNRTAEAWEAELPDGLDPLDRLYALLDLYVRIVREHPSLRVFFEDIDLIRIFGEKLDEIRLIQIGGPLHTILKDGQASGQFRPMDIRVASWLVFTLLDTVYLMLPSLMDMPGALDDPVLAEETKQFILRGLGAAPAEDRR